MSNLQIVIPSAVAGSRFAKDGWKVPKPFIRLNGKVLLGHVVENLKDLDGEVTVVLQKDDETLFNESSIPDVNVEYVYGLTEGTLCT